MNPDGNAYNGDRGISIDRSKSQRPLEFITLTRPVDEEDSDKYAATLRAVRSQAMRDHVWKEHNPSEDQETSKHAGQTTEPQSSHMGRFKLHNKSKAKPPSKLPRSKLQRSNISDKRASDKDLRSLKTVSKIDLGSVLQNQALHTPEVAIGTRFNPFDAALINLGSDSQKLVSYYHQAYSMNIVALNFQEHCLSNATADLALLHSILYIVASDYDLKRGESDSALSNHHGNEAVRAVNKHLSAGILSDTTIAAVAIIATRENLNGKFQLANMHMNGLQHMIAKRGGIDHIQDVHQRVANWADFCDANVRDSQPRFCKPPSGPMIFRNNESFVSSGEMFNPEDVLGPNSKFIPVIQSLRHISLSMDSNNYRPVDKGQLSTSIYQVEYDLNLLNGPTESSGRGSAKEQLPEFVPLKIAAHIFLYIMIRDLPRGSPILQELTERFCISLNPFMENWWAASRERQYWALWMLFVAVAASPEGSGRQWLVGKMLVLYDVLGIRKTMELKRILKSILWRENRCCDELDRLWRESALAVMVDDG